MPPPCRAGSECNAFGDKEIIVDRQIGRGSDCRRVRRDQATAAHVGRDVVACIEVFAARVAAFFDGIEQDGRSRNKQIGDRTKSIVDLGETSGMVAGLQDAGDQNQFEAADVLGDFALPDGEIGRIGRRFSEAAPVVAAGHQIFAGGQCPVEMIGKHVNRQRRANRVLKHMNPATKSIA